MKWFVMFLLLMSSVYAVPVEDVCSSKGYPVSYSSWTYNNGWIVVEQGVNVTGSSKKINWTSTEYIDIVVYRSGNRTYTINGGFNGTVPKTTLTHNFEYVAFCRYEQIPEFGVLGIVMIAGFVMFYFRKK